MVLISGLIASSYRRSYVTRLGARAPGGRGCAAIDGDGRRRLLPGNQYFSDPGDGRPWSAIRGTLFFPSYGYPIYGDGTRRRLLAGRNVLLIGYGSSSGRTDMCLVWS